MSESICSILRPTEKVGAVEGLAASGVFPGRSQEVFTAGDAAIAEAQDGATRS